MRVRDRTGKTHEHEGTWTYLRSALCPCRPCHKPRVNRHLNSQGTWVTQIECATRENNGCPLPPPKPKHVVAEEGPLCERCGARVQVLPRNEADKARGEERDGR
jgi:hypothetical protein